MASVRSSSQNGFEPGGFDTVSSSPADSLASKRPNTLANKITGALSSSSYADSEIRDALRLLDRRGAQNAETVRMDLKFDAQREVIEVNARIVDDFGKVAKQLQRVGALISILNQTCESMRVHIHTAKQETAPMLEEASTLLARKQEIESKQQLLEAFNQRFLISDEDLTTLTSSAEPVNDRYFLVLSQVKQIHKDCEVLLGYENQRLGLELLEQTTRNLDAGYKKLYTWIRREFKGLDLEDPRTSGSVRRSLRALSERPTLFENCLDFFAEAREVTLSEAFQKALTDSTIGSAKAIEFSTHDPLRYIGDMLAWVHSTTVSEKEALEGLFISDADEIARSLTAGRTTEPWSRLKRSGSTSSEDDEIDTGSEGPTFDGRAALNSLISRNMAAVAQTLKQRTALTIRNLRDPLSIYKAYNLLLFYEDIFIKLLGTDLRSAFRRSGEQPQYRSQPTSQGQAFNTILDTLSSLQSQALTNFTTYLTEDLQSVPAESAPELTPPSILATNLALMSSILRLRAPNLTKDEFANLYTAILTPVLGLCNSIADSLTPARLPVSGRKIQGTDDSNKRSTEDDSEDDRDQDVSFATLTYQLNYLHPIIETFTTLAADKVLSDHVSSPLKYAQTQVETLGTQLADLLTDSFLEASAVDHLSAYLETAKAQGLTVTQKHTHLVKNLDEISASLDTFLASAIMDAQDNLTKLSDKTVAQAATAEAVENFCEEFEEVVGALEKVDEEWEVEQKSKSKSKSKKRGGDDSSSSSDEEKEGDNVDNDVFLRELYPRTVAEVRALLS